VTLSDIDAPNSYTITGEGQGGVAGFAKGGAKVFLSDDSEGATVLKYAVHAQVGGKLAQLGARLIDATAKQMAEQFFTKFSDEVQKLVPAEPAPAPVAPPVAAAAIVDQTPPAEARPPPVSPPSSVSVFDLVPREPFGLPVMGWIGIALFAGMLVLTLASML